MSKIIDLSVLLTERARHLKNIKIEHISHQQAKKIRGPQIGLKENEFPEW